MKSKFVKSLGLTAAMVACAGMTAFAAPSPSAKVEQTTKNEQIQALKAEYEANLNKLTQGDNINE